jgi:hypothetical protein
VRPRAARIPGVSSGSLVFSSKLSKWLDEQHLVKPGARTNWKAQYKLRYNWTNGSSFVSELSLNGHLPPVPPLIRMRENTAVTVDSAHGLRLWKVKGNPRLLTSHSLRSGVPGTSDPVPTPTSIAIDESSTHGRLLETVIGFGDGGFGIYGLVTDESELLCHYRHPPSSNGTISAIAYNYPYMITLSDKQLLSLYSLRHKYESALSNTEPPRLMCSMRSYTAQSPLTVSLRILTSGIIASIAYVLPTYATGWTVGLQELRFTLAGTMADSRTTTAHITGYSPLAGVLTPALPQHDDADWDDRSTASLLSFSRGPVPTSLSYSHPYMLVSHPDNTLTLYLVRSTDSELIISTGRRLWGHTSSVSDVQVGERGRAISASRSGDEIRVWELEGTFQARTRSLVSTPSISVRPHKPAATIGASCRSEVELSEDHRVIGFDQEKVVTMREAGERTLVVYDFS